MLLSKEIAVYINLAACRLKQYTAAMLKQNNMGLTPEQFLLLDILWNQGPMSQQSLANNMQKDKNSVTKLVDALEKKSFIARRKNPTDKRSNIIVLTPKGEQMKQEAKQFGISMLDKVLTGISEEELRNFLVTLDKLSENMSQPLAEEGK